MTAPAPRNHPAEDAHPAPAPAPVAVPECGAQHVDVLGQGEAEVIWTCDAHDHDSDTHRTALGIDGRFAKMWRTPRPEPVTAPLPSEALRAALFSWCGCHPCDDDSAHCVDHDRMRRALTTALPHLRLAPQDDAGTVRVPWALLARLHGAYVNQPDSILVAVDRFLRALSGDLPLCADHRPIQHRDGKPPWCRTCGRTADGVEISRPVLPPPAPGCTGFGADQ